MLIPGTTLLGYTIEELDPVVTPATDLVGGLFEVETPTGPNGAFKNYKLTFEQLVGLLSAMLGGGGGGVFASDIVVSLAGGRTFGKYQNGQTIPAAGKTANEVILLAAVESLFPSYTPASASLSQSAPQDGEVGESVANTLTATFNRGDAGALTSIQINKDGARISTAGTTSPFSRNSNVVRTLTPIVYQAFVSYAAGTPKNVTPGNTPDTRAPGMRNPNAPQAAESNLGSNGVQLSGRIPWFYGSSATDAPPDIYGGNKVIAASNGQLQVPGFGSGTKWLWFAVPRNADGSAQKSFASWFRTALDNGAIGGATNLFRSPTTVPVTARGLAQNWARDFDLYFTNYATVADTATTLS